jgi:hypothetical protein
MSASCPPSGRQSPASAGRHSPAPAGRRSAPSPPSETNLLYLLDLDNCEDEDDLSNDFSLLNVPSAICSLGRTWGASAHVTVLMEGASPVRSVSATPIHMGGRAQSGGGGVGGIGASPSMRASIKGSGSPTKVASKVFIPKNVESLQVCIFLS